MTPGRPSSPVEGGSRRRGGRLGGRTRRERALLALGILIGALLTVFAVLNLDRVNVDWIVGTWSTPLIVVIVVSLLLGVIGDRCVQAFSRRRARRRTGSA